MSRQIGSCLLLACVAIAGSAMPAYAQRPAPAFGTGGEGPRHTVNFTLGAFVPRGLDGRDDDDVLVVNSSFLSPRGQIEESLDAGDFGGATFGVEWLIPIGNFVEAGAGLSLFRKTVETEYTGFIDGDGTGVDQELKLRTVPIALTVRVVPFGQDSPVQPYVGAGLAVINWRYSESGEFIDFSQGMAVFEDEFEESGTGTGPIFLGGLRFAGDSFVIGGEVRFHTAEAELPDDFTGPTLDLGGLTYQLTVGFRF